MYSTVIFVGLVLLVFTIVILIIFYATKKNKTLSTLAKYESIRLECLNQLQAETDSLQSFETQNREISSNVDRSLATISELFERYSRVLISLPQDMLNELNIDFTGLECMTDPDCPAWKKHEVFLSYIENTDTTLSSYSKELEANIEQIEEEIRQCEEKRKDVGARILTAKKFIDEKTRQYAPLFDQVKKVPKTQLDALEKTISESWIRRATLADLQGRNVEGLEKSNKIFGSDLEFFISKASIAKQNNSV